MCIAVIRIAVTHSRFSHSRAWCGYEAAAAPYSLLRSPDSAPGTPTPGHHDITAPRHQYTQTTVDMEDLWSVGYQPQRRYGPSRRAICLCSSVIISLIFGGIIYKVHSGLNGPDQVFNNKVGNESTNVAGFNMNSDLSKPIRTASAKQNGTALPGAQVSTTGNANEETSGDLDRNTGNSASDLALAGGFSTLDVNYDDIYVNAEYSYDTEYLAAPEDNHGATNPSDESSSRLAKRGIPPFLQGIFYYYYDMEDFLGFTDSNYTIGDEEINKASSVPAEQENATATRTSTDLFFLDANATSAAPSVAAHAG